MSRRALVLLSLLVVLVATALPTLSPWRDRGERAPRAEWLAEQLASRDAAKRAEAERDLVDLGPAALPALEALPDSAPAEVVLRARRAARAIRRATRTDEEPGLLRLERALEDGRPGPAALLADLGPSATPLLVRTVQLEPESLDRLRQAVEHAATHGGPDAAAFLAGVLGEDDVPAAVLTVAADGLIQRAGPEELTGIRSLLRDSLSARRTAAVRILLARGTPADRAGLSALLADPSPFVRVACAGLLADPSTRTTALVLLEDRSRIVRRAAVRALAGCADEEVVASFRARLDDASPLVRAAAVEGLALAGRSSELLARRDDVTVGVRLVARRALARP